MTCVVLLLRDRRAVRVGYLNAVRVLCSAFIGTANAVILKASCPEKLIDLRNSGFALVAWESLEFIHDALNCV